MNIPDRIVRAKQFSDTIGALVAEFQDVLGPVKCATHDDEIDDCDDTCDIRAEDALLGPWVLVYGWHMTTPEDMGTGVPDYFTSEGSMSWEALGLMHHAIRDIDGTAN